VTVDPPTLENVFTPSELQLLLKFAFPDSSMLDAMISRQVTDPLQ
jgi:hypothetical protein